MVFQTQAIEHGGTRSGRWLGARRTRIALWIAVAEGILVAFHVISWWPALLVAALVVMCWFWFGHRLRQQAARQLAWIAATSQALVALVPLVVLFVGTLALILVGVLALAALAALFGSRV